MIRPFQTTDWEAVRQIWLEGNLAAHPFVAEAYWRDNLALLEEALPQAEVYVSVNGSGAIEGFIGLQDETFIAGLFVAEGDRSRGVGKALLDFTKARKPTLSLHVYEQNTRALAFYLREGFTQAERFHDPDSNAPTLLLTWLR